MCKNSWEIRYHAEDREAAWKKLKPSIVFANAGNESKADSSR